MSMENSAISHTGKISFVLLFYNNGFRAGFAFAAGFAFESIFEISGSSKQEIWIEKTWFFNSWGLTQLFEKCNMKFCQFCKVLWYLSCDFNSMSFTAFLVRNLKREGSASTFGLLNASSDLLPNEKTAQFNSNESAVDCTANKKAKRLLSDATAVANFNSKMAAAATGTGTSAQDLGLAAAAAYIQNAVKMCPDIDFGMLLKEANINASTLCKTSPISSSLISNEVCDDCSQ